MPESGSLLRSIASLPKEKRQRALAELTDEEALALWFDWRNEHARPTQVAPPGNEWTVWFIMTGRGWGKTRSAAEFIREEVRDGRGHRVALVGETAGDVRDTMIEGESGILAISPPDECPKYEPSKRRLTWPNGAVGTTFSAEEPDQLRGPEHDLAWCDELAAWKYLRKTWDNMLMGLRIGENPRCVATTTPRPLSVIREIIADKFTVVTRGTTYDNLANLAEPFRRKVIARFEGTRLGRQELRGELLDDVPGALWTRAMIDANRVAEAPDLQRIVVAVDPAVTSGENSDETGIVVCGLGVDGEGYVLADYTGRMTPGDWAKRVVAAFDEHEADRVVAEVNNGGDLVEANVRTERLNVPYKAVHASRGKRARAEPVASLYEQGRVHHAGTFDDLEDQMCNFVPDTPESPDRVDALVWGITEFELWAPRKRVLIL